MLPMTTPAPAPAHSTTLDLPNNQQKENSTTSTSNNNNDNNSPYYSTRQSSFAVAYTDDDGIRNELNRLSLQQELMRQELLNAIATLKMEDILMMNGSSHHAKNKQTKDIDDDRDSDDDDDDHVEEGVIVSKRFSADSGDNIGNRKDKSSSSSYAANAAASIRIQEEAESNPIIQEEVSKPWYTKLLLQRKPTLEQEIKRHKLLLKQELAIVEDGLQDIMEVQKATQDKLVLRARFQGAVRKIQMGQLIQQSLQDNVQASKQIQDSLEATIAQKNQDMKETTGMQAPKKKYILLRV